MVIETEMYCDDVYYEHDLLNKTYEVTIVNKGRVVAKESFQAVEAVQDYLTILYGEVSNLLPVMDYMY